MMTHRCRLANAKPANCPGFRELPTVNARWPTNRGKPISVATGKMLIKDEVGRGSLTPWVVAPPASQCSGTEVPQGTRLDHSLVIDHHAPTSQGVGGGWWWWW